MDVFCDFNFGDIYKLILLGAWLWHILFVVNGL